MTVPLGISLSTHIPLSANLIPENSIVPQAATETAVTATTTLASSSTALIQSLYAEVQQLEAQIAALEASSTTNTLATPQTTSSTCTPLTLTQSLSLGSKGAEVTALQQFLENDGYYSYPSITGYFGTLTEAAVGAFQSAENIVSSGTATTTGYGAVGPKTRAKIAALTSACEAAPSPSSTTTATSSTTATTTSPGLITPISAGFGGGGGSTSGNSGGGGGGGGGSAPDTTPPSVSLTAPSGGATVSGTSVTLTATASDNVAVANVQFKVDGTNIGSAITSSPYTTAWKSTGVSDGSHTLYAVAEDTSGNYATSSESVTVENTPVSISSISSGTPTTISATITWTTNENASSTVLYGATTAYGGASSSVSFVTSHSIIVSGLTASTTYHFQVQATNAAGNYATSTDQTFTTAASITAPTLATNAASSIASTTVTLNGAITDTGGANATQSGFAYGTSATLSTVIATSTLGSQSGTATFLQNLTSLTASTTYYFRAYATNGSGAGYGSIVSFTTSTNPPVISSISSSATTTSATITWTTDQSSNSKVAYGLTTGYGAASSSASDVTSHSLTLTGLSASTTYDYEVVSTNTDSQTSTSTNETFTTTSGGSDTQPPTQPTNLVATPQSSSQINLSWTASTDNVGVVGYKIYRDGIQMATDTSGTTFNDTGLFPSTLHSYWVCAYDAAGNVSTNSASVIAESEAGTDAYGTTWKPLRIGAGGYVDGIDVTPDGTMVVRTDTFGAYIWDGIQWDQLVSSSSMPAAFVTSNITVNGNNLAQGVYEIQAAPSASNIMYMLFDGYILKSVNRGATWTQTSFAQISENANDNWRWEGQKMAIDPNDPNIVYAGTPQSGLFVTNNGGASWQNVSTSSVPASTLDSGSGEYPGLSGIMFDPGLGVNGSGSTNTIFAPSFGHGIYESVNAGASWSQVSSGLTGVYYAAVSPSGVYYVVNADGGGDSLWSYASGTWTELITDNPQGISGVAVDPSNSSILAVTSPAGYLNASYNDGATWSGVDYSSNEVSSTDIPWLAAANTNGGTVFMDDAGLAFNPLVSNQLISSAGTGVWNATLPSGSLTGSVTWNDQSVGIEQLVANEIISPPGGTPESASWDRAFFSITNPDVYPSSYSPVGSSNIVGGWSLDYASSNPGFLVGIADNFGAEESGYSTNGGQSWTDFTSNIPSAGSSFIGGSIAASSPTNIVWAPADGYQPYYTTDGGTTWNTVVLPGVGSWSGFDYSYSLDARTVTADRVLANTFYLFDAGNGLYKSTNGGATWAQVYAGDLSSFDGFNAELQSVPGEAGNLFFTGGGQSGFSTEPFMHSTNGGATWSAVPNVTEVYAFGFGKAATGTTTPAIYIAGWVNSVYGIYESDDGAQTWTQVGLWPVNSLDYPKTISGDMNAYGRVYAGFNGSGYAYGNTTDAQIPPIISSISSGTPNITSATITWNTDQSSNSEVVYGTTTSYGSASSSAPLVTSHSITLTGLSSGTTYRYEVVSVDASGYTATSTDHTFTTYNSTPPSVPTGLTATATSSSEIDLSWNASTGDGTYPVAGYQIFRNSLQVGTTTSGTTYADTGLAASTTYSYTVDAYDTGGNVSAHSSSASTTTLSTLIPFLDGSNSIAVSSASASTTLTTAHANDVIILQVEENANGGNPTPTVSDAAGLAWTLRASHQNSGTNYIWVWEYYATTSAELSGDRITFSDNASANYVAMAAFGVSGANMSAPFDGSPVTGDADPLTITTTNPDTFITGFFRLNSTPSPTAGTGWTNIQAPSGGYMLSEYLGSAGTQSGLSVTIGTGAGTANGGIADAIKH